MEILLFLGDKRVVLYPESTEISQQDVFRYFSIFFNSKKSLKKETVQ